MANIFPYPENFALWSNVGQCSVTSNAIAAPDGTMTADLITEDTSTGVHTIQDLSSTATIGAGVMYSSIFVKSNGRDFLELQVPGGELNPKIEVNLSAGTVTSIGKTCGIEAFSNGWYRIWFVQTTSGTTVIPDISLMAAADFSSYSYTGDGTSGVYVWGIHSEISSSLPVYVAQSGWRSDNPLATPIIGTAYPVSGTVRDQHGNIIEGATVTVYDGGTQNASTLYNLSSGVYLKNLTGTVTTDSRGRFIYYVDDAFYPVTSSFDVVISKSKYVTQTYSGVR